MSQYPPKGPADFLDLGNWNAACFQCGRKFKASEMLKHWQGYYVCVDHWEPRHPQDFVRGVADKPAAPWVQQETDTFIDVTQILATDDDLSSSDTWLTTDDGEVLTS